MELVLSHYLMGSGAQTQVARPVCQRLYPLRISLDPNTIPIDVSLVLKTTLPLLSSFQVILITLC